MSNVDPEEIARFDAVAARWWDPDGEMRPLHDLNPVRLAYVERDGSLRGSEAMARRGARVTGLDLAAEVLEVARAHARNAGIEVSYQLESAEDHARLRAGQYDIVTCMEMLEHVPDPPAVITALAALVKPGGAVFLSTINRTPRAYVQAVVAAEYVLRLLPTGTHAYEKFIRPSELAAWGRSAGLALEDVSGLDYDPFGRSARLTGDARVNYVMQLRRTGGAMEPG